MRNPTPKITSVDRCLPLQGGVREVNNLKREAYREEPRPIRLEVSAEIDHLCSSHRVQQPAQEVENGGVRDKVQKVGQCPLLDAGEPEVEPPNEDRRDEDVGGPKGVNPIESFVFPRVQDQRHTAEEVYDGEAKDDRYEDGQVLERIHCQLGSGNAELTRTAAGKRRDPILPDGQGANKLTAHQSSRNRQSPIRLVSRARLMTDVHAFRSVGASHRPDASVVRREWAQASA
jgi:hypothetical protein